VLELTRPQIDLVVHAAAERGTLTVLMQRGGLGAEVAERLGSWSPERLNDPRLSRSFLLGLWVLSQLPADRSGVGVAAVVAETGMSKSTTHRYLTTLVEVGLAEQDSVTRKYRLAGQEPGNV
jgi:hypothetical protein